MIASLPMYDRPENAAAHDALWSAVRDRLGFGPTKLDREIAYDQGWGRSDLVLGQICNLPYRAHFRHQVTRIGNTDYGLQDTPAGYYHSLFVVRSQDAVRGLAPATLGRFAYNDALSHSGWGAPLSYVSDKGLTFHSTLRSGSHLASIKAVAGGDADLAAIDAVTWGMLQQVEPATAGLSVIGRTRASPGMTFITAKTNDPEPIRAALIEAIADLAPPHKAMLGLRGLVALPDAAFDLPIPASPERHVAIG